MEATLSKMVSIMLYAAVYLKSIDLQGFRNFASAQFEFSPGLNILFGQNAAGKTNLLEAICLLSNLRSFRTHSIRELMTWNVRESFLRGVICEEKEDESSLPRTKTLAIRLKPNTREVLINAKPCTSSKEYLQIFPSVAFHPDDLTFVKGSPASRRYFLDRATFHFYPPYWSLLTEYNRALKQRNSLLREVQAKRRLEASERSSLEVWESQLQMLGSKIILQRIRFTRVLQQFVKQMYLQWMNGAESIQIRYTSSIGSVEALSHEGQELAHAEAYQHIFELYGQALQRHQKREYQYGTTLVGPHRDDLDLEISEKSLKAYGSQGQQRTAILAVKLAESYVYYDQYAEYPVLLLDDVTSELDMYRNARFLECLQQGMQVFISATEKPDVASVHNIPCSYIQLPQQE
ncbi:DNA replication and repair protein recF [Candidatus Vecturithrix granuli]|uniref:DNA replication and repair protein RecF n=1 Tax=Vecturithrix granuli TaxID=1499967 RepID=A0A0S6WA37_VECG1|nr:DNA replication and repair protein recF [Candidatus Vecturithrix granuli]